MVNENRSPELRHRSRDPKVVNWGCLGRYPECLVVTNGWQRWIVLIEGYWQGHVLLSVAYIV